MPALHLPGDVLCALLVMLVVSGIVFAGARKLARRRRRAGIVTASLAGAFLLLHALWLNDNLVITRILPTANALIYGNIALPAAAMLAGAAWALLKVPQWQRVTCAVAITGLGVSRMMGPVIGSAPTIGPDRWTNGVCRQSSTSTCSAASAATLLRLYDVNTSERAMIDACLTHVDGTSMLGLYRGLKVQTAGTSLVVMAGHPRASELRTWGLPAIVTIGLKNNGGWLPIGNRHSVVVLDMDDTRVEIADPFSGRQSWTFKQFDEAYAGDALAIKKAGAPK